MDAKDGLPIMALESQQAWEAWLEEHHETARGVWLRIAKKASGIASVTNAEAVESSLCFGWIDGQRAAGDERTYLQRFSPRTPRSRWSRINRDRALELIEEGRMRPAGLARVEEAKADGRWEAAYAPASQIEVPDDLRAALDADPAARATFEGLSAANRYAILYRLHDAKRPETRARRLEAFLAGLREGRGPLG